MWVFSRDIIVKLCKLGSSRSNNLPEARNKSDRQVWTSRYCYLLKRISVPWAVGNSEMGSGRKMNLNVSRRKEWCDAHVRENGAVLALMCQNLENGHSNPYKKKLHKRKVSFHEPIKELRDSAEQATLKDEPLCVQRDPGMRFWATGTINQDTWQFRELLEAMRFLGFPVKVLQGYREQDLSALLQEKWQSK